MNNKDKAAKETVPENVENGKRLGVVRRFFRCLKGGIKSFFKMRLFHPFSKKEKKVKEQENDVEEAVVQELEGKGAIASESAVSAREGAAPVIQTEENIVEEARNIVKSEAEGGASEPLPALEGGVEASCMKSGTVDIPSTQKETVLEQDAPAGEGMEGEAASMTSDVVDEGASPASAPSIQDEAHGDLGSGAEIQKVIQVIQSLSERMGAIETAFPILRKDVLNLSKSISGFYTTTTDRMHAKLEKYERDLEQSLARPYLLSIMKIGDTLRRSIRHAEAEPGEALKQLRLLMDDVRVPLWNAGLRVIEVEPGVTPFNPRLHDGVDIVPTGNKALDGIIESVQETGYLFAPETDEPSARPRVFRASLVRVFKFDKALEENQEAAGEPGR